MATKKVKDEIEKIIPVKPIEANKVTIKVLVSYLDKYTRENKNVNDTYEVEKERADYLVSLGYAEII